MKSTDYTHPHFSGKPGSDRIRWPKHLAAAFLCATLTLIPVMKAGAKMESNQPNERYDRGLAALQALDAEASAKVMEGLKDIAPEMARFIIEFGYGDVYSRPGLDPKTRQVATIAALTALGNAQPQLQFHMAAGLNAGLTPQEIIEVIYVTTVFAGFPCGLNAISAAREVFRAKGVSVAPAGSSGEASRRERGLSAVNATSQGAGEAVLKSLSDIAPDMGDFIVDFAYGDVIARKGLDPAAKEIAMIASTVARGTMAPQMKVHIHAALNVGCSGERLVELMYHMAVYAGFPAALNGISVLREALREREAQKANP